MIALEILSVFFGNLPLKRYYRAEKMQNGMNQMTGELD